MVLEIDVDGARQVKERGLDALLMFLEAPSRAVQEERLRGRGDPPDRLAERLAKADQETDAGRRLGAHVVVNDQVDDTVAAVAALIDRPAGSSGPRLDRPRADRSGPGRRRPLLGWSGRSDGDRPGANRRFLWRRSMTR